MIDPVDLPLVEDFGDGVVDRAGALEIASDRLLDDDPCERLVAVRLALDEARAREMLDRRRKQRGRDREIVDPIAGEAALVLHDIQPRAQRRARALVLE